MIGEFHLNYNKAEPSPEFILILFGLPIMDVAGSAVASTSHFSNPYIVPGAEKIGTCSASHCCAQNEADEITLCA